MNTQVSPATSAGKQTRAARRAGVQATTNWLPVPVKWPARSTWNQPQPVKIRQTPPWSRPGLTLR